MKKILITTLLFLMSITPLQAKQEVEMVSRNEDALIEVNNLDVSSDEKSVEGFVARLYRLVLGREPDASGFDYWVKKLKKKEIDGADTVVGFFESKEMNNKNLSDEDYLELLYKSVLNRNSDAGGKEYWLGILKERVTRRYILKGFVESKEFTNLCSYYKIERGYVLRIANRDMNLNVTKFVNRLYDKFLGRIADINGLEYWTKALLKGGSTGAEVVKGFVKSEEMKKKNLSNKDYVTLLYNAIFDRKPDTTGLNYWLKAMDGGKSKDDVLAGFIASKEFQNLCAKYGITAGSLNGGPTVVESNAQSVFNYLTKTLKYSKPAACGIMANMYNESHFMPTVGSYYYGICQWGGGRRTNLFSWCEANGYDATTVKGQLHFMDYELKNIYTNTYQQMTRVANSAAGAGEACNLFLRGYEGASVYDGRYELAMSYYNQY